MSYFKTVKTLGSYSFIDDWCRTKRERNSTAITWLMSGADNELAWALSWGAGVASKFISARLGGCGCTGVCWGDGTSLESGACAVTVANLEFEFLECRVELARKASSDIAVEEAWNSQFNYVCTYEGCLILDETKILPCMQRKWFLNFFNGHHPSWS